MVKIILLALALLDRNAQAQVRPEAPPIDLAPLSLALPAAPSQALAPAPLSSLSAAPGLWTPLSLPGPVSALSANEASARRLERRARGRRSEEQAWERAVGAYLDGLPGVDPETATGIGVHSADGKLTSYDLKSRQGRFSFLRRTEQALDDIHSHKLGAEARRDYLLLMQHLQSQLEDDPAAPEMAIETILTAPLETISLHFSKPFASDKERARTALSRLEEYPRILRQGRRLIVSAPSIEVQSALEDLQGVPAMLRQFNIRIDVLLPRETDRTRRAVAASLKELERFKSSLEALPRRRGGWAYGREAVDAALIARGMEGDAPAMKKRVLAAARETLAELKTAAEELYPGLGWRKALERAGEKHPPVKRVLELYRSEIARARRHIRSLGLVTLPRGDKVEIEATPAYARNSVPEAAYEAPLPLDASRQGTVFITMPHPGATREEVKAWQNTLGSQGSIELTAVHEAVPGHHLEASRTHEHPNLIRRTFWDVFTGEGWAHYTEGLMLETGFMSPVGRLSILQERYWQQVRARVALGLHTEGWSLRRAARYLSRKLGLDQEESAQAARRYALGDPLESLAYSIGRLEILRLRSKYSRALGPRFSLKEFHDRFLSYGAIPLPLIEEALDADWLGKGGGKAFGPKAREGEKKSVISPDELEAALAGLGAPPRPKALRTKLLTALYWAALTAGAALLYAPFDRLAPMIVGLVLSPGLSMMAMTFIGYGRSAVTDGSAAPRAPPADDAALDALRPVVAKVAAEMGLPEPVSITLLRSDVFQAHVQNDSFRSYRLTVAAGVLQQDPSAVEAVIRHELAHVLHGDNLSRIVQMWLAPLPAALALTAGAVGAPDVLVGLVIAASALAYPFFQKLDEYQADQRSAADMGAAGLARSFIKDSSDERRAAAALSGRAYDSETGWRKAAVKSFWFLRTLFSSHPTHEARIARLARLASANADKK